MDEMKGGKKMHIEEAIHMYFKKFKKDFNYFAERLNGYTDKEIVAKINVYIESGKEQKQKEGLIS